MDSDIKEEERFDFEAMFDDFGAYLDARPEPYKSRYQKWFRIMAHMFLALATAGAWVLVWTAFIGYKFFANTDMDKYKSTVLVQELPEENSSDE